MRRSHQETRPLATALLAKRGTDVLDGRPAQFATVLFALLHQSEDVPRRREPKLLSVILKRAAALDRRIEGINCDIKRLGIQKIDCSLHGTHSD